MPTLNPTHDPQATSWVASAQATGADFPIQNLPLAVFRRAGSHAAFRGGVAIGDQIIDLAAAQAAGVLDGLGAQALAAAAEPTLNHFFAEGPSAWRALRHGLFDLLHSSATGPKVDALRTCLVAQFDAEFTLPARVVERAA